MRVEGGRVVGFGERWRSLLVALSEEQRQLLGDPSVADEYAKLFSMCELVEALDPAGRQKLREEILRARRRSSLGGD